MRGRGLAGLHPAVCTLYFLAVLGGTVVTFHPVLLAVSLICALSWGRRLGCRFHPAALAAVALVTAAVNPLFSHRGVTVLAYFPGGNPLTLESVLFGLGAALMLLAAVAWCACLSRVMTADRWMCLLGRGAPTLSLLLSMILRFVPRFRRRLGEIRRARRGVGLDAGGSPLTRAADGARELSILLTWSLEGAVDTGDSMAARGYGLPGRTAYTAWRLEGRDRAALALVAGGAAYLLLMGLRGALTWRYYPALTWGGLDLWSLSAWAVWLCLCAAPVWLERREEREWKSAGSGM